MSKQLEFNFIAQSRKRDAALHLFEEHRQNIIQVARVVAHNIANKKGRVTSPEVVREMLEMGYNFDGIDMRFMGGVFRKYWERIGFENKGSHCQPISIWKLKKDTK